MADQEVDEVRARLEVYVGKPMGPPASRQKQELETKALRVNPQDKQSPITLQNNISVVNFQVSVLRRMALTMEINEANNLFRLAIGTGLLICSEKYRNHPEASRLLKALNSFHADMEKTIDQALQERKTLGVPPCETLV